MLSDDQLAEKINSFLPQLDERLGRLYLASEAKSLGRGGKQKIAKLAKVSRTRIDKGLLELASPAISDINIRKKGGGRKKKQEEYTALLKELESIVNPYTRGDPMNPLLWTSKSLRLIRDALTSKGFNISYVTVGVLLKSLGYSLQANKKTEEGGKVADRNEQFEYINSRAISFMSQDCPVISVDCKKKELIGNYKNTGTEWEPKKNAPEVNVYDFVDKELGKAVPYGVYDIAKMKPGSM